MDAKREQVDARMAAIEGRFVGRLSADEFAAVRERVEAGLDLAAALRSADVDLADEPALYPSER